MIDSTDSHLRLTREVWNGMHLDDWGDGKEPEQRILDLCESNREKILDLGCGDGRHLIPLVQKGLEVVGLDISPEALIILKRKLNELGLDADLYCGTSHELPFNDNEFGTVISIGVIHHNLWKDIVKTMKEIRRVIIDGGQVALKVRSTNDTSQPRVQIDDFGYTAKDTAGKKEGVVQHYFTKEEIEFLAENNGFDIVHGPTEKQYECKDSESIKARWDVILRAK
ncbi:class I SAM-dependent methyltransferase [Patescibacteria group bacterium]|nr:class I SAM-dependent methyltransferase [Patescibacteria group bacterium]MBU1124085.1 class I SAM-dependent methyltransferase [Patescibacteria group bacterium]MBU1911545.1 class I SAM-dependent methyltransferase [Patescibacteria group bacterium]